MDKIHSNLEAEILSFVSKKRGVTGVEIINNFEPSAHCNEILALLKDLCSRSLLSRSVVSDWLSTRYFVTSNGVSELIAFLEQQAARETARIKQQAKDEARDSKRLKERQEDQAAAKAAKKKDHAFDIFSLVLGAIITLIISNWSAIFGWACSLIH